MYKAILFDLDGTLSEFKTGAILPNVKETIAQLDPAIKLAICSNQGGVGLRYWMEADKFGKPEDYPTEWDVRGNTQKLLEELGIKDRCFTLFSFAYQSKKSGKWNPNPPESESDPLAWQHNWRKPDIGMLTFAMEMFQVSPDETLFVGDWDEDRDAAGAAKCHFQDADEFFNRDAALPF